jgi:hypothetical protein
VARCAHPKSPIPPPHSSSEVRVVILDRCTHLLVRKSKSVGNSFGGVK